MRYIDLSVIDGVSIVHQTLIMAAKIIQTGLSVRVSIVISIEFCAGLDDGLIASRALLLEWDFHKTKII